MSYVVTQSKRKREQDARNSKIAKQDGTVRFRGQKTVRNSKTSTLKQQERVQKRGVSRRLAWVKSKQGHKRTQ